MRTQYIFWTEKASSLFLYGSTIQIFPNHRVVFKNERMAPSLVIHEWRSKYNFQGSRRASVLPNLKIGQTYYMKLNAIIFPKNTIHVKINFFNQFNEIVDYIISTKDTFEVTVPEDTYEYGIQLINAGCHTIDFSNIEISLLDTAMEKFPFYTWVNVDETKSEANILFVETSLYEQQVSVEQLQGLTNVFMIPCSKDNSTSLLNSDTHVFIKNALKQYANVTTVHFIGYGVYSNFLALAHSRFFDDVTCHITDLLLSEASYKQVFGNQLTIFKDVSTILNRQYQKQVKILSIGSDKKEMFRLQSFIGLRPILIEMQLISES